MKKRLVCLALAMMLTLSLIPAAHALTDLNIYAESSFDKEYDVYSGPGVYYYRANNGRATYGWGGVRVYGVCGDWVMIGYGLSNGAYRIGYVSRDCLNHTKYVTGSINYNLVFSNETRYATNNCYVTDDPVLYNDFICQIPQGRAVTVLGEMGQWLYIEASTDYGTMRGFVYNFALSYTQSSAGNYDYNDYGNTGYYNNDYGDTGYYGNTGSNNPWSSYTNYAQDWGVLNRPLATRSGPGTLYDEPGSFLGAGYSVLVHSRVYDQMNEIWWLQVEFTVNGFTYWAYTGQQRLDGVNLSRIPIERQIGSCEVTRSLSCCYAPGGAACPWNVPAGVSCKIYGYVSGWMNGRDGADWIQIEFYDYLRGCTRRAWVQDPMVDNYSLFDSY